VYQRASTLGLTPPSPALINYYETTDFLQQKPASLSQTSSTDSEIPLDIKAVQDHMAVQALVRSYQVGINS
jgi:hypothetical protein